MAQEEVSDWLSEMDLVHAAASDVSGASIQIPSTENPRGTVIVYSKAVLNSPNHGAARGVVCSSFNDSMTIS